MAPSRTRTMKNKNAAPKGAGGKGGKRSDTDGVSKSKVSKAPSSSKQVKDKSVSALFKKRKPKKYTEAELGVPTLNMVTPVGVVKPKGKKKGKVFVDDRESMNTILSIVQAEKNGQIESKMIKARQMEEIREARRAEAEKKDEERQSKLENVKDSLRRKRKKKTTEVDDDNVKEFLSTGSKATKASKKKVAFA
ncbi:60S ribosomal subunit assembly/export protein LOC1 [Cordyceps militaris CM01]|uniref:60S ribosomal subunit assembly/export protein LOC1 n=2 Tax=Cordyceps militaris TaxID=73501 RepID=G3J9E5_CORMM|nr:60S ribosomal subunit assembly/export protein LOC1 [Cordyceps militaris CM01]ATY60685.1 60S ribosomal subunit assembly export LOC1 [Cordyceps militaris]EGX94922.1 60S ribosomal subunit assembly/export protein LOC1 [Cordyceps militaris CM01]